MHKQPEDLRNLILRAEEESLEAPLLHDPIREAREKQRLWLEHDLERSKLSSLFEGESLQSLGSVDDDFEEFEVFDEFFDSDESFDEDFDEEVLNASHEIRNSAWRRHQSRRHKKAMFRTSKIVANNFKVRVKEDRKNKSFCHKRGEKYVKSRCVAARALMKRAKKQGAVI